MLDFCSLKGVCLFILGQGCLSNEKPDLANKGTLQSSKTLFTVAGNISSLQTSFVPQELRNQETNGKLSTLLHNVTASQTSFAPPVHNKRRRNRKKTTSVHNVSSLQASFVPQEHRNGKSEETFMEIATNGNDIGEHAGTSSNLMHSNAVSVSKQTECNNVSKIQVKQNNNCSKTNINGNGYTGSLSVLEKIRLFKQQLKDDPTFSSRIKLTKNGNINHSKYHSLIDFCTNMIKL